MVMIVSEDQRKELSLYIEALEDFCAYSINEDISRFWDIVKKPHLIQKWREKTAILLYKRENCCRWHNQIIEQHPGAILGLSGYFSEPICDDPNANGCLDAEKDNWNETILNIDRQICKGLCAELCNPDEYYGNDDFLTEKQRTDALRELRKPLMMERQIRRSQIANK